MGDEYLLVFEDAVFGYRITSSCTFAKARPVSGDQATKGSVAHSVDTLHLDLR